MDNKYNDPAVKEVITQLKRELAIKRAQLNEEDIYYPHIQKVINEHWND